MPTISWTCNIIPLEQSTPGSIVVDLYYKPSLSTTWTLFASNQTVNANGTLVTPQTITINQNESYDIKAVDLYCGDVYQESIIYPCANECAPGYVLSVDGTYCYFTQTTTPTPPTDTENAVSVTNATYSTCGSWIFAPGYNSNGTGTATQINPSNSFWINGSGGCLSTGTTGAGPLNRIAIWTSSAMPSQTVGYAQCFSLSVATTIYIGFGSDNYATLQVDGANVIVQDPAAMDAQFGTTGGEGTFRPFCIYPLTLSAGEHVINMIGTNSPASGFNPASIGCEIYENTAAEIAAATSTGDLDILFSTENVLGQPIQIGNMGIGYQCGAGYSLNLCSSPPVCQRTLTSAVIC
jgi:hypothetical protein